MGPELLPDTTTMPSPCSERVAGPSCSLRARKAGEVVREAGLEPATSRLSAGCSNRLSHPRKGKPADQTPRHKHDGDGGTVPGRFVSLLFSGVDRDVRGQLQHFLEGSRQHHFVQALTGASKGGDRNPNVLFNPELGLDSRAG